MKNTKKAFTLVELIVVITILAVLATVAFISFSGQTKEANKSKVVTDLANLSRAIEIADSTPRNLVTINADVTTRNSVVGDVNSGSTIDSSSYAVGLVDFAALGQNGEEFVDSEGNQYLLAYYASGSFNKYQVVGQTENASGNNETFIKGSYYQVDTTNDLAGLVSSDAGDEGVTNGEDIGTASIY